MTDLRVATGSLATILNVTYSGKRNEMNIVFGAPLRQIRGSAKELLGALRSEILWAPRTRRRLAEASGVKLNVGCGALPISGFVNIDRFPAHPDVLYWDARRPLPLSNETVTQIHCEHFIEHLEVPDALALLSEFRRVLILGGTLRLICPDAGRYIHAYARGDAAFFTPLERLGGAQVPLSMPVDVINQMFRMGGAHRHAWDFESLARACEGAGLTEVRASEQGEASGGGTFDGTDGWRRHESVYLVASRPRTRPIKSDDA